MKAEIKKQKDTKVEIDFELDWEELETAAEMALQENYLEVIGPPQEEEINKILASYPQINPKEIDKEIVKSVIYNNKVFSALEKFCDK